MQAVWLGKPLTVHTHEAEAKAECILKEQVPADHPRGHQIHVHCFTDSLNVPAMHTLLGLTSPEVLGIWHPRHRHHPRYDFSDTSKVALVIQALMGFKHLYDAKLVSIHLLAKPTEVDLKRPFKAVSAHPTNAVSLSPSSSRT
ncbi:hypothetical protein D9615_009907 [Tricholomella constricta]|uniref:Uncharacterized protein n=1 Tax=Tricholomella constricta TaxID=117010 RepID=A0A8H5GZU7_9AGAR|nr:hypothetical protein D9615_009907 [Tricholomella constricta]